MLSTDEIICLYDNGDYDTILTNLEIFVRSKSVEKSKYILDYAISTENTQLFTHMLSDNNLYSMILLELQKHPILFPQLELILASNCNLCTSFGNLINSIDDIYYVNVTTMKIIIRYITNINKEILEKIFYDSVQRNDIDTLKSIIISIPNIKFIFRRSVYFKIDIATFIFLEENGIDIIPHINKIGEIYLDQNNIDGLIFCLNHGASINLLLKKIDGGTKLHIIKFLIENGADVKCLGLDTISILFALSDLETLDFLIDSGLDITNNLNDLMMLGIENDDVDLVTYCIKLGIDIHLHNELFLGTAVKLNKLDVVKILLDHGAEPDVSLEIINFVEINNRKLYGI
jgi:hypothetical protein